MSRPKFIKTDEKCPRCGGDLHRAKTDYPNFTIWGDYYCNDCCGSWDPLQILEIKEKMK